MPNNNPGSGGDQDPSEKFSWNQDAIFTAMVPARCREILVYLTKNGPGTVSDIEIALSVFVKGDVLRHLGILCEVGPVTKFPNHADKNDPLYGLDPLTPASQTEEGVVLDFSFALFRLEYGL